ncbi:MAG: type II secretion system F family protein [Nanoarchaeota archaeon]
MTKVPFSILPDKVLERFSVFFMGIAEKIGNNFKTIEKSIKEAELKIDLEDYIAKCLANLVAAFLALSIPLTLLFLNSQNKLLGLYIALVVCFFILVNQVNFPRLKANKRIKSIDRNLLPTLRTILIQINSGVPLFDVFVNIAKNDYGEISKVFDKMVKKINSGKPQVEALEEIAENNSSIYFRKSIWQLINGMKAGSNLSNVIKNIIDSLSKEQIIQIENYGSQLNPLAMFYMLVVIIVPSLGVTFITVMSSFLGTGVDTKYVLIGLFIFVFIFQIIFLGMIKTKRPSLLEE